MSWELTEMAALAVLPDGGTAYTKSLLCYLCARAKRDTSKGWSSVSSMARVMPASENTARAELHRLDGWGAISLDSTRVGAGRGNTHRFTVHREWLERHLPKRKSSRGEGFRTGKGAPGEDFSTPENPHPVNRKSSPGEPEPMKEPLKGTGAPAALKRRRARSNTGNHEADRPSPVAARATGPGHRPGPAHDSPREGLDARQGRMARELLVGIASDVACLRMWRQ